MADEVNPRVAQIDADLQRWQKQKTQLETRLAFTVEQIRKLEELREVELDAKPPALPEPGPGVRDEPAPSSEG